MIEAYLIISTLAILFIAICWSNKGFVNLTMKYFFHLLAIWGVLASYGVTSLPFHIN